MCSHHIHIPAGIFSNSSGLARSSQVLVSCLSLSLSRRPDDRIFCLYLVFHVELSPHIPEDLQAEHGFVRSLRQATSGSFIPLPPRVLGQLWWRCIGNCGAIPNRPACPEPRQTDPADDGRRTGWVGLCSDSWYSLRQRYGTATSPPRFVEAFRSRFTRLRPWFARRGHPGVDGGRSRRFEA